MSAGKMTVGIVLLVCVFFAAPVWSTTHYVKTDGNDKSNGLTWATAFKTIQKGVNTSSNGDIVEVNEGTYYEAVIINKVSCTITSTAPNDWDVVAATVIDSNRVRASVSGVTASVSFGVNTNANLYGVTVTGGWWGIYCYLGSGPIISRCIITDNNGYGIYAVDDSSPVIENNKILRNRSAGVYLYKTIAGTTVRNNWIYDNGDYGIQLSLAKSEAVIRNNTIAGHKKIGIAKGALGTIAPIITNCIIWNNNDELYRCSATYSCIKDCNEADGTGNICGDANSPTDLSIRPSNPVHYWKLDETSGSTAYDSAGNTNGTFNGSDPCWVNGLIGGAFDCNGVGDYFSVSALNTQYYPGNTFTVAGWFKTSQSTGSQTIVGQWSQFSPVPNIYLYFGWQILVENKKVVARFGMGNSSPWNITGTSDVNNGRWHHCALVYPTSGSNAILYVDGQSQGTPGKPSFAAYNTKFRIGDGSYVISGSPPLKGGPFKGTIDDVMLYDRVLSPDDVLLSYQGVFSGENYHLDWNSPCFNTGDPNYEGESGEIDIDGEQRVIGGRVEIGADEMDLFPNKIMYHNSVTEYEYDRLQTPEKLQYLSPDVVWSIGRNDDNADKLREMISRLRIINPKITLCSYLSSCTAVKYNPDLNDPWAIRYDAIDSNWFLRDPFNPNPDTNIVCWTAGDYNRAYINITDANARAAIINFAIDEANKWGLDALSFDNCFWDYTPCANAVTIEGWRNACLALISEAKTRADACGLGLYVNVGVQTSSLSDALTTIEPDVNGIIFEMSFPINCRTDYYVAEELSAYKDFLEKGKQILLYHQWVYGDDKERKKREQWVLCKIRPLAEKYNNIYLGYSGLSWYGPEPLLTYNANLVTNGDFNDWTGSGDPCNWQVSGTNGIRQVGYVQKTLLWNQTYLVPLQDHKGWWRKDGTLHEDPNYGVGACNLYTTGGKVSISQNITAVPGETYRCSIFIGQTDPNDPNNYDITGSIKVSVYDGNTTLAQYTYGSAGVKTFTFEASSANATIKIENANSGEATDVTFDDVAVWLEKE